MKSLRRTSLRTVLQNFTESIWILTTWLTTAESLSTSSPTEKAYSRFRKACTQSQRLLLVWLLQHNVGQCIWLWAEQLLLIFYFSNQQFGRVTKARIWCKIRIIVWVVLLLRLQTNLRFAFLNAQCQHAYLSLNLIDLHLIRFKS